MILYKTKQGGIFSLLACLFIIGIYLLPFNGFIRDFFDGYNDHDPMILIAMIGPIIFFIFMTLHVMFSCIIIDDKFIEERNGTGSSKVIYWNDLISITETNSEGKILEIKSKDKAIIIKENVQRDYKLMKDIIVKKSSCKVVNIDNL